MPVAVLSDAELRELLCEVKQGMPRSTPTVTVLPAAAAREVLSEREAQQLLGVSRSTLARGRKSGRIPYKCLGRRVLYVRADLIAALAS